MKINYFKTDARKTMDTVYKSIEIYASKNPEKFNIKDNINIESYESYLTIKKR